MEIAQKSVLIHRALSPPEKWGWPGADTVIGGATIP
jgi:hypothetical protein